MSFNIQTKLNLNSVGLVNKVEKLDPVKLALEELSYNIADGHKDHSEQERRASAIAKGFSLFIRSYNNRLRVLATKNSQVNSLSLQRLQKFCGPSRNPLSKRQLDLITRLYDLDEEEISDDFPLLGLNTKDKLTTDLDDNPGLRQQLSKLCEELIDDNSEQKQIVVEKFLDNIPNPHKQAAESFIYRQFKQAAISGSLLDRLELEICSRIAKDFTHGNFGAGIIKLLQDLVRCHPGEEHLTLETYWLEHPDLSIAQKYLVLLRLHTHLVELKPNYMPALEFIISKFEAENSKYIFNYFSVLRLQDNGKLSKLGINKYEKLIEIDSETACRWDLSQLIVWVSEVFLESKSSSDSTFLGGNNIISSIMAILGDSLERVIYQASNPEAKAALFGLIDLQDQVIKVLSALELIVGFNRKVSKNAA